MQRSLLRAFRAATPVARRNVMIASPARLTGFQYQPRMLRFASTDAAKEDEHKEKNEQNNEKPEEEKAEESNPEVLELKQKLEKKDKELAEMKSAFQKAVADFRSLQDSTKKEIQKSKDFALQKFAKDLLESVDNFTRALEAVKDETLNDNPEVKNLYDGVVMTRNVFEKTLKRHGIERISPLGEEFDPNVHEATFELPDPNKKPGTVFHVQQDGYTLNSRVLRPAKVGLVKSEDK